MGQEPVQHKKLETTPPLSGSLPAISRLLEQLREVIGEPSGTNASTNTQSETAARSENKDVTILEMLIAARKLSPDWTGGFVERLAPEDQEILRNSFTIVASSYLQKLTPVEVAQRYPTPQEGELVIQALNTLVTEPELFRKERLEAGFHTGRIVDEYFSRFEGVELPENFYRTATVAISHYVKLAGEGELDDFEKFDLFSRLHDTKLRISTCSQKRARADFEIELAAAEFTLQRRLDGINIATREICNRYDLTLPQSDRVISLILRAVDEEIQRSPSALSDSNALEQLIERADGLSRVSDSSRRAPDSIAIIICNWYHDHHQKPKVPSQSAKGGLALSDLSNQDLRGYLLNRFHELPDTTGDIKELRQYGKNLCPYLADLIYQDHFDTAKIFLSGAYILTHSFKGLAEHIEQCNFDPEQTRRLCHDLLAEQRGTLRAFFQDALIYHRQEPSKYLEKSQPPLGERTRRLYLSLLQDHLLEQLPEKEHSDAIEIHALAEFCETADSAIEVVESCSLASRNCPKYPISQDVISYIKHARWALARVLEKIEPQK